MEGRPGRIAGRLKAAIHGSCFALVLLPVLVFAAFPGPGSDDAVSLTHAEKQWLAAHPTISLAPHPDYPPIEYFDEDGCYRGIAADYTARIEKMLGIRFRIVRLSRWDEVIEAIKGRRVDMLGAAANTPWRSEYMLFTNPFVEVPIVFVVRKNVLGTLALDKLSGMRVAVVSGFATCDYLARYCPGVEIDPVPNVLTGLRKVSFGMADVLVTNLPTITHHIESDGITNLRFAGSMDHPSPLGFAVRKDWPELAAMLDKGLAAIGREERNAIYRKWVRLDRDTLFSRREFWIAVAGGLAVVCLAFAGLVAWNRSLKSLVGRRTRELSEELAERKLAEESLRIAEARYHGIFENAVEGIYQTTPDGRCTEVNPACARIFGYDSPGDLKRSVRDVGAQLYGDPKQRLECLKILEEREVAVIELVIRRKDGSTGWVSNNVRAVRDESGRLTHLEGIVEDVTELKRAEEELWKARNDLAQKVEERTAELRAANEELQREIAGHRRTQTALRAAHRQLQDIIEFLPDATLVVDRDKRVIAWNRVMEEMTGTKKQDILGRAGHAYAVPFYGEPLPMLIDMVVDRRIDRWDTYDLLESKGDTLYGENYVPAAFGGRGAYLWGIAAPLFDTEGNLIGAIESIRDMTHHKRAERELRESEKRLRVLSSRLLTAQEEERRRMARDVHDSLGSVLTGVKISLENMYGKIMRGEAASQSIDDLVALTRHAIRECRRIITGLRPSVLDDYGIIVTLGWLCRHYRKIHPGISIEEKIDIGEEEIEDCLKTVIFRISQEALNNAGKHSKAQLVQLALTATGGRIVLSIEDNGVGFTAGELFEQDNCEEGFGLAGMRERAEFSGGTLFLWSIPGRGTKIEVLWPRKTPGL